MFPELLHNQKEKTFFHEQNHELAQVSFSLLKRSSSIFLSAEDTFTWAAKWLHILSLVSGQCIKNKCV